MPEASTTVQITWGKQMRQQPLFCPAALSLRYSILQNAREGQVYTLPLKGPSPKHLKPNCETKSEYNVFLSVRFDEDS
eukprot:2966623-Amphidinium_carterae.2